MQVPVEAISGAGNPAAAYQQLPDPQPVDISKIAAAGPADHNAFATLAKPAPPPTNAAKVEWTAVADTVSNAMHNGVVKPHLKELEGMLKEATATGQPAKMEDLMLVSMKVQEGSAVTSFLTQAVNSTRQSLQTLVERS
jgi:hypothetical protein